ncbi:YhhN-like protein [Aspergillus egyptiacus]|nr:YhhN-like protein [Aspergillus egyptiacus]
MPPSTEFQYGASMLLASLPLLVWSEHRSRSHAGTVAFKILSSLAFLAGPCLTPAPEWSSYRKGIATGLLCSLLGDFFLLPARSDFYNPMSRKGISTSFQLGVVAFAAAHVAYIVAFMQSAQDISVPILMATFTVTMGFAKWLGVIYPAPTSSATHNVLNLSVPSDMKPLVLVYAAIISSMFGVAVSTTQPGRDASVPPHVVGAAMFVISDVFVAKDAFGRSSAPRERGWFRITVGYGLYFWGQMVIAGTAVGL